MPNKFKECPYCGQDACKCTSTVRDKTEIDILAPVRRTYFCMACGQNFIVDTPKGKPSKVRRR